MRKRAMNKIKKILLEKALGYERDDVLEEYSVDDTGTEMLVRRKVQTKYYPPDLNAMKTYLEMNGEPAERVLTEEELTRERERLLSELQKRNREEEEC